MSDDAFQFVVIHQLQQTGGGGDGSVLRIAAGGECVRRFFRNHVQLRHRKIAFGAKTFHHRVKLRRLFTRHRLRMTGFEGNLIGEKIGADVHHECDREGPAAFRSDRKLLHRRATSSSVSAMSKKPVLSPRMKNHLPGNNYSLETLEADVNFHRNRF